MPKQTTVMLDDDVYDHWKKSETKLARFLNNKYRETFMQKEPIKKEIETITFCCKDCGKEDPEQIKKYKGYCSHCALMNHPEIAKEACKNEISNLKVP